MMYLLEDRTIMKITIKLLIISCIFIFGCAQRTPTPKCICPSFPVPPNTVIEKLANMHDIEVDNWVIRLYQHKQMIDIQNKDK